MHNRRAGEGRSALFALTLFFTLSAVAQTRQLDGVVQKSTGEPLAGMTVAITPMPVDEAEDVEAWTSTDANGHFRFEHLRPARYQLGAASATISGASVTIDLTADSVPPVSIVAGGAGRTISGRVTGTAAAPHVIAGHFHDQQSELYVAPVRDGRYAIMLPAGGQAVVQALAPQRGSIETPVQESGDAVHDLVLEARDTKMPDAARSWLKSHAIPLKSVNAGSGFDDMRPIRNVIGDARIVALGEQTHGTREFFQFKHRMLEFLVSQMGFNLFGIEASMPDAIAVDDYVLTGKGDPAVALRDLGFWTWNTEEVLDMIRWMRKWNEDPSHTRKVRFYGFDMQNPAGSQTRLREWLKVKSPAALTFLDATEPLGRRQPKPTPEERAAVAKALDSLGAAIDAIEPRDATQQTMRHLVEVLRQANARDDSASSRDRAMAENIRWILDHEGAGSKMVVWAHNGHVSAEPLPFAPGGTMGVHLRETYGRAMVVIGFVFDHGTFQAVDAKKGLMEQHAGPIDDVSFDRGLASAGLPLFVVDLRTARGATHEWLDSTLRHRSIGAGYNEAAPKEFVSHVHPLRSYDAVFFIDQTTTARTVRVPRSKPAPAAVNLSFDDGIKGWTLPAPAVEAGYAVHAETTGCFKGGCAVMTMTPKGETFGSFMQRIDATPYRGKTIRFRAHMKSQLTGSASSARIWLRVDRPNGTGFFDNMAGREPQSLPEWTELEITGEVAADAEAIAFGELFVGGGTAWIDETSLEVVNPKPE